MPSGRVVDSPVLALFLRSCAEDFLSASLLLILTDIGESVHWLLLSHSYGDPTISL